MSAFTLSKAWNHCCTMPLVVLAVLTPAAAVGGLATLLYAAFRRS